MTAAINIVIPMAGAGSRFASAGFDLPKPLIEVRGVPMIRLVIENLRPQRAHRFIFVVQSEHMQRYGIDESLRSWAPGCEVVSVDRLTEGAAISVLTASELIDNNDPLMIANSDQWVNADIDEYLAASDGVDGLIMTMTDNDPKWSFAEVDGDGLVLRVVEKEVVSNEATVGIYNFARGSDFVRATRAMVAAGKRSGGEFYVAPVYNELIDEGAQIRTFNVGGVGDRMYGLGIPADLAYFVAHPASDIALGNLA